MADPSQGAQPTCPQLVLSSASTGVAPGLPYPPQAPQGLMPYGQPRPPILGYGGTWILGTRAALGRGWEGVWTPPLPGTLLDFREPESPTWELLLPGLLGRDEPP